MRYLLVLIIGLMSFSGLASSKLNLYQAEVVLDEQQSDAEANARMRGLQEVIIRTSGDKQSVNNEVIGKALRQSAQYLNQISYGQQGVNKTLNMTFSAPHIRSLLTQAQLPFWPETRTNVLVWVVEESNYDRYINWEHSESSLMQQLKTSAQLRGLPITIPVGDFDDITGIQTSDLWGGFTQPISFASQRYPTDAVLVVRVQGTNLRWTLYDQPAEQMLTAPKTPLIGQASGEQAISSLIDEVSDYYAKKGALLVSSESSQKLLVEFKPVNHARDFFTLEEALNRLSSVASLDVVKIKGNEVTFNVHLLASQTEFEQEVLRMRQVATRSAPLIETPSLQAHSGLSTTEASASETSEETAKVESEATEQPHEITLYFSWQE
ncbi:DUF2066 domain-containing protein [Vibrio sp. V27_P1S3P104]|uniref:DUF2066 domain-containing protein n=1 Tax=unclassified Vibrio TaxID=2614977 RepID=UPI0013723951|nr:MULTISPECIES: DUF2066 domain-containing protein [unclassified Vibrio]NAW68482.1 DUF2066 domain-containing protein [Vibrio sp. V28_P6S34P95]NAX06515.1 DUF2066 domain-containing protein [Vibrio sp. V30_P3S12P165]NAX33623.1 DUF2066 domain-containing protein [Vibrio sp. V29_P1S30P107]NAX38744.1 DUF2066 domain-containing protein [Vibrio sp. V27_P1S3P104]NAX40945.1 DUF2066 domain-containing protein [Vibrio sp. V26_P1S5P106]